MSEHKIVPFELTKVDGEKRTFEGYASTFRTPDQDQPDLTGDMVVPGAFRKTIVERGQKVRMLWQHDPGQPIGKFMELREDAQGLYVNGIISDTRLGRDCLALLRDKAIDSMSIGYDAMPGATEYTKLANGKTVRLLKELRLWEISLVTFPADEGAVVTSIKSAIPSHTTDKASEDTTWDAGAVLRACEGKAQLRLVHAWLDPDGDPEIKGSYKLPHHLASGEVVWRGVAAAAGRLDQAQIPEADLAGVRAHLARHYEQFDKPVPWEGKAFKATDFVTMFANQQDMRALWEMRWQIQSAFDAAIEGILSDEQLDGAGKLRMMDQSCMQYGQALSAWAARAIAIGGKSAPEPLEVKAGRRLSTATVASINAAIDALIALRDAERLLADEPDDQVGTAACDRPRKPKDDEKNTPVPDAQAVTDSDSAKAGPEATPPTDAKAVGPEATPPPSGFEKELAELEAGFKQIQYALEGAQ